MTQKLDELFNIEKETTEELNTKKEVLVVDNENLPVESYQDPMQAIVDLVEVDQHSKDMDSLADLSMESYEKIKEYADNSEEKNYASIMAVAVQMQRNAIDAKNSKMKAKHEAAKILLKKQQIEDAQDLKDADVIDADMIEEDGSILADRNSVLNKIRNKE